MEQGCTKKREAEEIVHADHKRSKVMDICSIPFLSQMKKNHLIFPFLPLFFSCSAINFSMLNHLSSLHLK